jgi:hypothetical protein
MIPPRENFMTKYVPKSTIVIALEALLANELRTLSSGV